MQLSQAITRRSASNLALAFVLLPKEKRHEMAALYAFCREVDDIADEDCCPVEERRKRLAEWREDLQRACNGVLPGLPVARELQPVIEQHRLPFQLFDEVLKGVEMDLDTYRYPDYEALEQYCYRVASAVGLLSIEVFGYTNPACRDYAIYLGKALQFTNILRDVRGDALRGRIYLPLSELEKFRVSPEEILRTVDSERFRSLAQSVAQRARIFYRRAQELLPKEDRRSMATAELMGTVYWRLLKKIEARRFDILTSPALRLSKGHKLLLIARSWCQLWTGGLVPNYGAG